MNLFKTFLLIGAVLQYVVLILAIHEENGQECIPCSSTLLITVPDTMLISINTSAIPCGEKCKISLATEAKYAVVGVTLHGSNTPMPDTNGRCQHSRLVAGLFHLCGNETTSVIMGPVDDSQVFMEDDIAPPSSLDSESVFLFSVATSTTEQAKECAGVINMSPDSQVLIKSIPYGFLANVFVDCTRTLKVPSGYDVVLDCPSINFPPVGINRCKVRLEIGDYTFCNGRSFANLTVPAIDGQVQIRVVVDNNRKITEFIRGSLLHWSQRTIYECKATLIQKVLQATTEPCDTFTTESVDEHLLQTVTPYIEDTTEEIQFTPPAQGSRILTPIIREGGLFPRFSFTRNKPTRMTDITTISERRFSVSRDQRDVSESNDRDGLTISPMKEGTRPMVDDSKQTVPTRRSGPRHQDCFSGQTLIFNQLIST